MYTLSRNDINDGDENSCERTSTFLFFIPLETVCTFQARMYISGKDVCSENKMLGHKSTIRMYIFVLHFIEC